MKFSIDLVFYRLGTALYSAGIHAASLVDDKARAWSQGRRGWRKRYREIVAKTDNPDRAPRFWIHCSSAGEFEQGRPLIEALRQSWPQSAIWLSFFSPSGYNLRHNYPLADGVFYLPADSPANARDWLDILRPDQVFFVKYEYWYFHLAALRQRRIPTYLISAIFRREQPFFKPWGRLHRQMLECFVHIFVQTPASAELLKSIGFERVTQAGDTRVDRALALARETATIPLLEAFCQGKRVLIAGSAWPADEDLLAELAQALPDLKLVVAPHELHENQIQGLMARIQPAMRITRPGEGDPAAARLLVLDTYGQLGQAYHYGWLAYVGGGFGKGIHNTLEPAAHGLPVIFGPRYHKFAEACALAQQGAAFPIADFNQLLHAVQTLLDQSAREAASAQALAYLEANRGATGRILQTVIPPDKTTSR